VANAQPSIESTDDNIMLEASGGDVKFVTSGGTLSTNELLAFISDFVELKEQMNRTADVNAVFVEVCPCHHTPTLLLV
jgi:hypothetical protein